MTLQPVFFLIGLVFVLGLYIALIRAVAKRYSDQMPAEDHERWERVIIGGIVVGVVAMFQPWFFVPFRIGFIVVLAATLTFILWSHISPLQSLVEE